MDSPPVMSIKVDFHCRVIFTCVNEIKAMYGATPETLPTLYTLAQFYLRALNFLRIHTHLKLRDSGIPP